MLTCSSPSSKPLHQNENFNPTPMDSSSDLPPNRPSPRQLQGPRPTPLKVRKDSYKISKKPPQIPHNSNPPPPQPPRPPVIIYTVSPKIIRTSPSNFMNLVQRLTGHNPDSPSAVLASPSGAAVALSPAARFAAIEKAEKSSPKNIKMADDVIDVDVDVDEGMMLDRPSSIPGILSPVPSSLQPISSSFFSPISSFDPGSMSFLNDLSPGPGFGTGGGAASGGGSFLVSPSGFLTPTVPSPGSCWDLFNPFQDL